MAGTYDLLPANDKSPIIDAIDNCNKGNPAKGRRVLEQKLRNNGFTPTERCRMGTLVHCAMTCRCPLLAHRVGTLFTRECRLPLDSGLNKPPPTQTHPGRSAATR